MEVTPHPALHERPASWTMPLSGGRFRNVLMGLGVNLRAGHALGPKLMVVYMSTPLLWVGRETVSRTADTERSAFDVASVCTFL